MLEIICAYLFHLSLSLREFAKIDFVSVLPSPVGSRTVVHERLGCRRNTSVGSPAALGDSVILKEIDKSYRAALIYSFILKEGLLIIDQFTFTRIFEKFSHAFRK
jgi:hypothetical protein